MIQEKAIPAGIAGRDVLGSAQTGTGKTCAFGVPILQRLAAQGHGKPIRALILTPTRELAIQIDECCRDYARYTPIRHCVIFGGVNQRPQVDALQKGVDLLVATPGRLLDLIGQGYVTLDTIRFFVLDEADRMLDMGFIHDIRRILPLLPERRQTLFFSATMPESIAALAAKILRNPVLVTVTPPASVVETIAQTVHFAEKAEKSQLLIDLLSASDAQQVLVFSRTKHGADKLAKILNRAGIRSCAIHGNKSQNARVKAMNDFKSGECRVMIATDIAARGIDIDQLPLVINYELPEVAETYVHRIGRTGRAGHEGAARSFCSEDEFEYLCDIQKLTGLTIPTEGPAPEYALRKAAPERRSQIRTASRPGCGRRTAACAAAGPQHGAEGRPQCREDAAVCAKSGAARGRGDFPPVAPASQTGHTSRTGNAHRAGRKNRLPPRQRDARASPEARLRQRRESRREQIRRHRSAEKRLQPGSGPFGKAGPPPQTRRVGERRRVRSGCRRHRRAGGNGRGPAEKMVEKVAVNAFRVIRLEKMR